MELDYEMHGFLETPDLNRSPFFLQISKPKKSDGETDYYCEVRLSPILKNAKYIYGTNPRQARTLARKFAEALLGGNKLLDQNGRVIRRLGRARS